MRRFNLITLFTLFWMSPAGAFLAPMEIVTERGYTPTCEEYRFTRDLRVYKDPSLFLGTLSLIYKDPHIGWENLMRENPLLTTLRGSGQLTRLGPPREFKNFGFIAKLYETVEPRLKLQEIPVTEAVPSRERKGKAELRTKVKQAAAQIVPVMLCGESDAYRNSMGFVLESDFKASQLDPLGGTSMPPSVRSIPEWRTSDSGAVQAPAKP